MPVLQQVDEEGTVIAEAQREQPDTVFGIDGLMSYAANFEDALAQHLDALSNGSAESVKTKGS